MLYIRVQSSAIVHSHLSAFSCCIGKSTITEMQKYDKGDFVFLCANTCVVHVPTAIISHEKPWVLSFLEEVVDFSKLSAVHFMPKGLIRLTFKELADKERLVSQGSIML